MEQHTYVPVFQGKAELPERVLGDMVYLGVRQHQNPIRRGTISEIASSSNNTQSQSPGLLLSLPTEKGATTLA